MAATEHSFFQDVYDVVRLIPLGKVSSYGAIARYLGTGGSARMVGWALNSVANDNSIPAHRVVNRQGLLTGRLHFETPTTMQTRLEAEGITVVDNQVQAFSACFWDPAIEIEI